MRRPAPSQAELHVLDPDGSFRLRLVEDRGRLAALAVQNPTRAQLGEIGRIVHQLAGAAGTFGFAEISDLAITLDDALLEDATMSEVHPMLADLLAAFARV